MPALLRSIDYLYFDEIFEFCSREGRDKIMFKHINEIINIHEKILIDLRAAGKSSQRILCLFKRQKSLMRELYGKFCINQEKANYIWKEFEKFITKLEPTAEKLPDLFNKYKILYEMG